MTTSQTIQLLESHVSIRQFREEAVSEELLDAVLRAACRAPTSSNLQAYSFVVVRDPATKARLAEFAGGQEHVASAPVFIAVCADLTHVETACEMHGRQFAGHTLEMGIVATVDATLAGMCAAIAAESVGLGYVMIGGMRNKPVEVARLLALPARVFVVFGMCLGWPAARPHQKPRIQFDSLVHREHYQQGDVAEKLGNYDSSILAHYAPRGVQASGWTEKVAADFSKPRRSDLRDSLKFLGFDFD